MNAFDYIAIAGALAWLPHVINYIKDVITKPDIRIITDKRAEIGFTTFGPIFNLRLAFAVDNKNIVISGIKIRVMHESGEEKIFLWQGIVQKMLQMKTPEGSPIPFEKELNVLAIKLNTSEVEERFIRFQDPGYNDQKSNLELKIAKKFNHLEEVHGLDKDEFLKSEEMKDLSTYIKHSIFWKTGKYSVAFEVESPDKFEIKDNEYTFELVPLDIEYLEKNKELIDKSFEDELKAKEEGYEPHNVVWMWRYPILKLDKKSLVSG